MRALDEDDVLTYDQVVAILRRAHQPGASSVSLPGEPVLDRPLCDPCFDGTYFLLYFFAGHQRSGDVHEASRLLGQHSQFEFCR